MCLICASNFTFCAPPLPKIRSIKVLRPAYILSFPPKLRRWIVLDLCWIMLPILHFVLHPSHRMEPQRLDTNPRPPAFRHFEMKMMSTELCLICAELCYQFYILCFTPSQDKEPQSFRTSRPISNFLPKMVTMNCASNFTIWASTLPIPNRIVLIIPYHQMFVVTDFSQYL